MWSLDPSDPLIHVILRSMWSFDPSDPLILHLWEHRLLLYIHAEDKVLQSSAPLHVMLRSCMFVVNKSRETGTAMYSHVWEHGLVYNAMYSVHTCRRQTVLQSDFDRVSSWTVTFITHCLWLRNLGYTWFSVHCLVCGSYLLKWKKKFKINVLQIDWISNQFFVCPWYTP